MAALKVEEQELLNKKLQLTIAEQTLLNEKRLYEVANEKVNFYIAMEKYKHLKSLFEEFFPQHHSKRIEKVSFSILVFPTP